MSDAPVPSAGAARRLHASESWLNQKLSLMFELCFECARLLIALFYLPFAFFLSLCCICVKSVSLDEPSQLIWIKTKESELESLVVFSWIHLTGPFHLHLWRTISPNRSCYSQRMIRLHQQRVNWDTSGFFFLFVLSCFLHHCVYHFISSAVMLNVLKMDKEKVSPWCFLHPRPSSSCGKEAFQHFSSRKIELNLHSVVIFPDFQPLQGRD